MQYIYVAGYMAMFKPLFGTIPWTAAHIKPSGRHFGMKVEETLIER